MWVRQVPWSFTWAVLQLSWQSGWLLGMWLLGMWDQLGLVAGAGLEETFTLGSYYWRGGTPVSLVTRIGSWLHRLALGGFYR